jgi:hypothetical protein
MIYAVMSGTLSERIVLYVILAPPYQRKHNQIAIGPIYCISIQFINNIGRISISLPIRANALEVKLFHFTEIDS